MWQDEIHIIQIVNEQGQSQDFDESEVYGGMVGASQEIGQPLSPDDLESLTDRVCGQVYDGMSSVELRGVILSVLRAQGYHAVADTYEKGGGQAG